MSTLCTTVFTSFPTCYTPHFISRKVSLHPFPLATRHISSLFSDTTNSKKSQKEVQKSVILRSQQNGPSSLSPRKKTLNANMYLKRHYCGRVDATCFYSVGKSPCSFETHDNTRKKTLIFGGPKKYLRENLKASFFQNTIAPALQIHASVVK